MAIVLQEFQSQEQAVVSRLDTRMEEVIAQNEQLSKTVEKLAQTIDAIDVRTRAAGIGGVAQQAVNAFRSCAGSFTQGQ